MNIISLATAFKNAISSSGLTNSLVTAMDTKTRPADTFQYAINDAICETTTQASVTPFTFANVVAANGGSGYITKASVFTDNKLWTAVHRLHLFNLVPSLQVADNQPMNFMFADVPSYLGWIDFDSVVGEDSSNTTGARAINKDLRMAITCDANSRNIFGVLQTKTVITPTSNQKFTIRLTVDQV